MGQENNTGILSSDRNFRPDARVWRMNLAYKVRNPHLYFGTFSSPSGQSEVNHPHVLADRLPAVWAEHLPLQYEALSGRGDTCLTVEEPLDPTLLKPIDQMSLEDLKEREFSGISIDTGITYKKLHPDGSTTEERVNRFYTAKCLTNIKFTPDSYTLSYKNGDKQFTATYSRKLSVPTVITRSAIPPNMYKPPTESI